MKIIFIGSSAVHHPLIAANIYLKKISKPDFRFLRGFCDSVCDAEGKPLLIAKTENGDEVYVLGTGHNVDIAERTFRDLLNILDCPETAIRIIRINVSGESWFVFLNRLPNYLGGEYVNYFVSIKKLKRQFNHIRDQVNNFRRELKRKEIQR